MKPSKPNQDECTDPQLRSERAQLRRTTLADEAIVCQQCGTELQAGRQITAYAYRRPDDPTYTIENVRCDLPDHTHLSEYTLGIHERLVSGHIGECSDVRTQSTWLVLLEPTIEAVSPPHTSGTQTTPDRVAASNTDTARGESHHPTPTTGGDH